MRLIATTSLKHSDALTEVAREMSFNLGFFSGPEKLADRLADGFRTIVVVAESDIDDGLVTLIEKQSQVAPLGVIIATDPASLRSASKSRRLDALIELRNVEWVGADFGYERLASSARYCRRRMLRLTHKDLERAFEKFEFVVRYQPKVQRGQSGEWLTREVEALVRWNHPDIGLVGPLEFLDEIEAFGMMGRLTEFVLRKSAAQLVSWREQDMSLYCSVNLAPSLLNDESLGERFAAVIAEFGVESSDFSFEIAERDLQNPDAPHLRTIHNLRAQGFRICIDNFKVVATALGMFESLPFDEIKIHASALKRAQADPVRQTVLAAVTGLAHNLGIAVSAEGVEDEETFEFLKTIECDKMQGFLISEAVLPRIIRRVYSPKPQTSEDVA